MSSSPCRCLTSAKARWSLFLAVFPLLAHSPRARCDNDFVVDAIIDQVYDELAKRRGLTRISAPEATDIQIGGIYYIASPACEEELYSWQGSGNRLQLFSAASPAEIRPAANTRWTTVRLTTLFGKHASGEFSAQTLQQRADISSALRSISHTNAEFSYAVVEAPALEVRRSVTATLESQRISDARDVSGDAAGIVSPHAQLVIQNFTYDKRTLRSGNAGISARILNALSGALSAGADRRDEYGFRNPTFAIPAIKPIPFLFRCKKKTDQVS